MKSKRGFLEPVNGANSWYKVQVNKHDGVELTLADCTRNISWWFGQPGSKEAIAKITKVKALVDEVYDHLLQREKKKNGKRKKASK